MSGQLPMRAPEPEAPAPLASRVERTERAHHETLDVLVIGGGITGAGIALDLALRGVRVGVVERGDWAGATSSASSRLVHGGLRYLENFEFGLVRDSCLERALLLENAAGMVWPERFTFPVRRGDRVGKLRLAAGLGLYTLVSIPRVLGIPQMLSADEVKQRIRGVATGGLRGGGSYLDGATDDARLTLAVVTSAIEAGAVALSRTELEHLDHNSSGVQASLRDQLTGEAFTVRARRAVFAGGPFTEDLRARAQLSGTWVRPTRGAHIIVPRERLPTDGAVIFPTEVDGRIMFLIPWPRYTIVGTTDLDASAQDEVRATREEVRYLLASANALVPSAELGEADVVSTWAGLRPLIAADENDPSARSREERLVRDGSVYTIAGGKLTGYRSMAEKVGARLTADLGIGRTGKHSPTRTHRLRGALPQPVPRPTWSTPGAAEDSPLSIAHAARYAGLAPAATAFVASVEGGQHALDEETLLGEVDWAVTFEDALTAEDFFFRRTNLGLGPTGASAFCSDLVLDRMAQLLGWKAPERAREADRLRASLARCQRWQDDPPPPD